MSNAQELSSTSPLPAKTAFEYVDSLLSQKRTSFLLLIMSKKKAKGTSSSGMKHLPFWLVYQAHNMLNKSKGLETNETESISKLMLKGMSHDEALECQNVFPSFSFVNQEERPSKRANGKRQHYNLTQVPSDVDVNEHGFALDYHIAIFLN